MSAAIETAARAQVEARARQGFGPTPTDPVALARIARAVATAVHETTSTAA